MGQFSSKRSASEYSSENATSSSTVPPVARKSSTPCLAPSEASGRRTILTNGTSSLEVRGQSRACPTDLNLALGVGVEGDEHLAAYNGYVVPVRERKPISLPRPHAEESHCAQTTAAKRVGLLLTLDHPERRIGGLQGSKGRGRYVQSDARAGRLLVLDHLPRLLPVSARAVGAGPIQTPLAGYVVGGDYQTRGLA